MKYLGANILRQPAHSTEHGAVNYPAVLSTEGTYTLISFPDCPGCRTYAEPGENVVAIAQDALAGWLETTIKAGKEPQAPTLPAELSPTERLVQVPVPPRLAHQLEFRSGHPTDSSGDGRHLAKHRVAPRGRPPSQPADTASEVFGAEISWKRPLVLLWRAVRLRCPNCGGRPLFRRWLQMQARCPVCGIRLERGEEGYQVGAYMFNIVAAELIFAALFLGVLIAQWPTPSWDLLLYGGIVVMLTAPVLFYPISKTLFLAFDLIFRPPSVEDFE